MDRLDALQPHQEDALRHELTQALNPGPDAHFARQVLDRLERRPIPQPAAPWARSLQWAGAALALGVCLAVGSRWAPQDHAGQPQGVMARGSVPSAAALLGFEVYRHPQGQPHARFLLRDGDRLPAGDGITFALLNRGASVSAVRILLVDAQEEISWLQPAEDSADNTVHVPARRTLELDEGITLTDLPQGTTRILAVFGAADVPRAALQKMLQGGGIDGLQQIPGVTAVQTLQFSSP